MEASLCNSSTPRQTYQPGNTDISAAQITAKVGEHRQEELLPEGETSAVTIPTSPKLAQARARPLPRRAMSSASASGLRPRHLHPVDGARATERGRS